MKRIPNTHKQGRLLWLRCVTIILLAFFAQMLNAQDDVNVPASGCAGNDVVVYPAAIAGVAMAAQDMTVTGTGGLPATISLRSVFLGGAPTACNTIAPAPPCILPFVDAITGINITISGTTITVNLTPTDITIGQTIIITLEASTSVNTCTRIYHIPVIRKPIDLMLVLDNSISMNCCTNIDDPTCVSCGTPTLVRMTKLKQAVDLFVTLGQSGGYFRADDKFGAVIFSGTLDNSHSAYVSDPTVLNTFIQGIPTSSGTCIGGGLMEGINQMTTQSLPNREKSLILFTDGEQNFNPMLRASVLPTTFEAGDLPVSPYDPSAPKPPYGTCMTFPASPPTFNSAFRDTSPGIKISTIGFKLPPGTSGTLLTNLANDISGAGGTTNIGSIDPFDFTTFFNNSFVELLSGSSPQIVKEQTGVTQEGTNTIEFITNDTLSKVTFMLVGDDGNGLRFKVKKNGADITGFGRIVDKSTYRLWHINFPIKRASGATIPTPGGTWTLETSNSRPGISYLATCIVDDHLFDFECTYGNPGKHVVGDTIPLSVSLEYKGKPITDAEEVVVVIERNTGDGGTSLAKLPTPEKFKSLFSTDGQNIDPGYSNLGQMKHYALIETAPEYVNTLARTTESITLTNNGDGTYSASYVPKVTGSYNYTYLIKGKSANIGEYHRTRVKSSVVNLTHFDLSPKNFRTEVIEGGYKFTMTMIDVSGLLLGPAFEAAFELKSADGKFGPVVDNLDGSYTVILNGLSGGQDPVITLGVNGTQFYNGNASDLGNESTGLVIPWWIWLLLVLIIIVIIVIVMRKK